MLHPSQRFVCACALVPVTLLGVAACGGSGGSGTPAQQAAALVTKGLEAQLAGDLATAQSDYQQATQLDHTNKFAYYDLGTVYDKQGNKAQAILDYQTVFQIDPNFVDALFNLGVDTTASDPVSAEQLYLKVVRLQPTFAAAWLNLGFILQSTGNLNQAKADWAKAVSLDPSLRSRIPTPSPSPTATSPTPTPTR
jgi:tetratricopeptide (TPR) repeat protein